MTLMETLGEVTRSLPFLLGMLAIVLLLIAFEVGRRLLRAARVARGVPGDTSSRWDALRENAGAKVVDWRAGLKSTPLKRSFTQVRRLLRQILPGKRSRYRTPWLLALGPAGAGTTTLLGHTGLVLPVGEPGEIPEISPAGCNWWLYDRAVAADLAGELVLQAEGSESNPLAWRGFLQLLRRNRTERPADAVLLTLSVAELLDLDPEDAKAQERLAERASVLRRKLLEAQERLGLRLPVFFLLTQCDRVRGWQEFVELLDPELRGETFGWSAPGAFDKPYSPSWVDRTFASVQRAICLTQLRALNTRQPEAGGRQLSAFPSALARLELAVGIVVNQIFAGGSAEESPVLRGLYFCGGSGFPPLAGSTAEEPAQATAPSSGEAHRRVDFLRDLFSEKILYEWNLARPTAKVMARGRHRSTALKSMVAVALLSFPWLLWLVAQKVPERATAMSVAIFDPVDRGLGQGSLDRQEIAQLLRDSRSKISDYRLGSPILPWALPADHRVRHSVAQLYSENSFPVARQALASGLGVLAQMPPRRSPTSQPVLDIESVPEFGLLTHMTHELGRVENGLRIYDCFVPKGLFCGTPGGFLRLEEDLYGQRFEPPNPATRRFYRRVLREVEVAAYSGDEYQPKLRRKTLGVGRWMFESLFEDNAVITALHQLEAKIDQVTTLTQPGDFGAGLGATLPASSPGSTKRIEPEALAEHASELLQLIEALERWLDDPDLGWIHPEALHLGSAYDLWWRSVGKSRFLGAGVQRELTVSGNQGFTGFQDHLVAPRSDIGALVERSSGSGRFELSSATEQLRRSLRLFLSQPFSGQTSGDWLREPDWGEYLLWRQAGLDQAVAAFTDYDSSIATLDDDPRGVEVMRSRTAQMELSNYVLNILSRAQNIQRQPDLASGDQLEDHLEKVAGAYLAQSDQLDLLLARLQGMIADPVTCSYCDQQPENAWCQLKKTIELQREYLFAIMYRLLGTFYPYRVDDSMLARWDGTTGPGTVLFDFADQEAATSSFEAWLAQIQKLDADYISKLLTATGSATCFVDGAEERRFQLIQEDLKQLAAKKPNNAIGNLRGLVTETMMTVDASSCLEALQPRPGCFSLATPSGLRNRPCDYFLGRRNDLADALEQRCAVLGVELAKVSYGLIQRAFAGSLEGKYPFTAELEAGQSQASRADVVSFSKIYDGNRAAVESFIRRSAAAPQRGIDYDKLQACRAGAAGSSTAAGSRGCSAGQTSGLPADPDSLASLCGCLRSAAEPLQDGVGLLPLCDFMVSLDATRQFFDPYLVALAEDPESDLSFALEVDYRVQRQREVDANQIIRWAVEVAGVRVPGGSQETPATWAQGQPVKLRLDWAQDGLREPVSQPGGPPVVGKSVVYDYPDSWALLTLLAQNQSTTPGICPDTLELNIPTVAVVPPPAAETSSGKNRRWLPWLTPPPPPTAAEKPAQVVSNARVFIRVRLQDGTGQVIGVPLPMALEAPDFPLEVALGTW